MRCLILTAVLLASACGCTEPLPPMISYSENIASGEALYAVGRYKEAYEAFGSAAKAVDRKNDELFVKAAARAGDAFCMQQFADARKDLAANDVPMARVEIDTALADAACAKFTEQVEWARGQKMLIDRRAPR